MKRESDTKELNVFRSDRYFVVDGKWFFTTREGANEGPFATADEARRELKQYLMDKGIRSSGIEPWDTPGASN
jgi:Domain of unknown function (DUF6316)